MNEHTRVWSLQEAKAKFSEVVRLAQTEGPQVVTLHGKAVVKIIPTRVEESKPQTIDDILKVFQSCPYPEVLKNIGKLRLQAPMRNRKIDLG